MAAPLSPADRAAAHMRCALALLDGAGLGVTIAACRLQHAIDTLSEDQTPKRISAGTPTMIASNACDPAEQSQ